jgi:hypothetical protein
MRAAGRGSRAQRRCCTACACASSAVHLLPPAPPSRVNPNNLAVPHPSQTLLWYYAQPSVLQTVISATATLEGSPPYECIGLGAYSAPSATISRATLEGSGCADLLLLQSSPGAPAVNPDTQEGAGYEISVNLGAANPVYTNATPCPGGGSTCARPFVYLSPFLTTSFYIPKIFGTIDSSTCPLGGGATCPVTPHVARAADGLKVQYNNFNFPSMGDCMANLRIICTDEVLEVLGRVPGSSALAPLPYSRAGLQSGFNGTYRLKQCTATTGSNGAGLSFSWIDNAFMVTKLADGQDSYAYPPPPPRCVRARALVCTQPARASDISHPRSARTYAVPRHHRRRRARLLQAHRR